MNTKLLTLSLVAPALSIPCVIAQINSDQSSPNIILIMADDLGWGDVGFNGNTIIKTPNLDQMASDGLRFNHFYAACAVSSPTRASVLTGRNPFRTGIFNASVGIMRPEEVTIPELLQTKGYVSGHFGKWHLGSLTATEKDGNVGREGNYAEYNPPKEHGYEYAFVSEAKVPTWDPMYQPLADSPSRNSIGWNYIKEGEPKLPFGTAYWDIDGVKQEDNLQGDDSRVIMDRVIPFIDQQVEEENKFLAVVWFHAPHRPCVAGEEYANMYEGLSDEMRNYAGCITAMDDQIGRLRAHLAELGIDKNTMIWFCSDNGPENGDAGSTGGYKERKRSLHEGGVRVPGVVVWPGEIAQGAESDFPAVTTDYLPTIASLLNIDNKLITNELDGVDLMPLLRGEMTHRTSPIVSCFKGQVSIVDNSDKIYVKNNTYEYYDICEDEYEKNPQQVPSDKQHLVEAMQQRIKEYQESFEGAEYGTSSLDRTEQRWEDPFKSTQSVK